MQGKAWIVAGAVCAGLAVAFGAFGAHWLPNMLASQNVAESAAQRRIANLETGASYQMYHGLALLAIGIWQVATGAAGGGGAAPAQLSGWLFLVGIILFSGSLYGIALTGITRLGMVTPVGGSAMIIGWLALAFAALR